jgi:hypothetical protein
MDEKTMTFQSEILFDHCRKKHPLCFSLPDGPLDRDVISDLMGQQIKDAQLEHEAVCKGKWISNGS